ncbi:hypothetical protein FXO37_23491 [Capsicum annuum]|nr:hypothetical protein FXO37_23491 [Capsicum annuum]
MTREDATKLLVQKSEGFYIMEQSENGKASRWNFDNLHYDHVMYANGLFCVWNQDVESVRISNPKVGDIYMTSRGICNSCDGEIVFVVIELGYFTFYFHDVVKNSWRKLKTNEHPYEGYVKDVYSYKENLFPLGRIWSPCGDDFVSSEEELPCGGDFVSSEEELSCGDDFVT